MKTRKDAFSRRDFIRTGAAGLCAAHIAGYPFEVLGQPEEIEKNEGGIPLRPLGKTGEKVAILCLGGHHIGRFDNDDEAVKFVRYAIDHGVTFLDNAWEYHRGRSEEIVGKALKDGYRNKAFVMTKFHGRDKKSARQQIEDSLRRLQVDTIDLCQAHEVIYQDDPERLFADDGGMAALLEAKKAGKIRFIGFTGHKDPELFLQMLRSDYDWDTLQMPVNAFDPHYDSFIAKVIPVALKKDIAVLAMKTMGGGLLLRTKMLNPEETLRYAWSQPVATVVSGMNSPAMLKENIQFARRYQPMTQEQQQKLLQKTAAVANEGQWEKYKTANTFDGWYGRTIHGGSPPPIPS